MFVFGLDRVQLMIQRWWIYMQKINNVDILYFRIELISIKYVNNR